MHAFTEKYNVNAPLLSKLLDNDPHNKSEFDVLNTISLEALRDDLCQSLDHLLNTRLKLRNIPPSLTHLKASCLNYGVEDFSGYNFLNKDNHQALCHSIQSIIETFETRLHNVNVHLLDNDTIEIKRALTFRIEATVSIGTKNHTTSFESSMDIVSRNFKFDQH